MLSHISLSLVTFSALAFNIMVVEDTNGRTAPALSTIVACSKSFRKVSGKNCCCA